jgi:HAD superfamily hydrolase (TIGR01484 family)
MLSPLSQALNSSFSRVRFVFTDVDDTLTSGGLLLPSTYQALCDLSDAGFCIIPVTGGPAGWCDLIARTWPVSAVIGESGAFYMHKSESGQVLTRHLIEESDRAEYSSRLESIKTKVLLKFPWVRLSSDQFCRLYDLAIELSSLGEAVDTRSQLMDLLTNEHLSIKVSSIHINSYWGQWDKLSTSQLLMREVFGLSLSELNEECAFIGDSLNDESMFAFFKHSFGVANVLKYQQELTNPPQWVTTSKCGLGFVEFAQMLLSHQLN